MVWASNTNAGHAAHAQSAPPAFPIPQGHTEYQKKFRNAGGRGIGPTPPDRAAVLAVVDQVRSNLVQSAQHTRLSIQGLVARILSLPFFRGMGFTAAMFRQALFTQMLEASTAPTRRTMNPLDGPMQVQRNASNKYVWPPQYWNFLGVFGSILDNAPLDDPEVEAFEADAVPMLTFHQSKGLEFDAVYLSSTGREVDFGPALRTRLFSGQAVPFTIVNGRLATRDANVTQLANGDRDREVYVAMTRAKKALTILHDPAAQLEQRLHPTLQSLFAGLPTTPHAQYPGVAVKEWRYA